MIYPYLSVKLFENNDYIDLGKVRESTCRIIGYMGSTKNYHEQERLSIKFEFKNRFIINNNGSASTVNIINSLVGLFISSAYLSCIFDITNVKNSTTAILANSDGWNENAPILNQLVAPFTGLVNNTAINNIINTP